MRRPGAGSLTVVGTGIQLIRQLTFEAREELERADELLYAVSDPVSATWLERLNPAARSLGELYEPGRPRREIYAAMVEEILAAVRRGSRVCAAFYGHPGVFVTPSHEAIRRARAECFPARMLAAVSAEDCLFADLGIDPGDRGCQSYEATELLVRGHPVDPTAALVLWQVDVLGRSEYQPRGDSSALPVLVDYLLRFYPPEHEAVFYAASPYPICAPIVERTAVGTLAAPGTRAMSTLYVPPLPPRPPDEAVVAQLDASRRSVRRA